MSGKLLQDVGCKICGETVATDCRICHGQGHISDEMVQRACIALFELKSNVIGLTGSRKGKVTTETLVRTVLSAALQPQT